MPEVLDSSMVAISTQQTIQLPDGRELGYAEYGVPDGEPIFFFHGTPGSRLSGLHTGILASPRGARVIAPDRPGYGLSDFQPRRTVMDWGRDIEALADALDIERFAVLGYSGGGAFAAACAVALPERLAGITMVSSTGPPEFTGSIGGFTRLHRLQWFVARRLPPLVRLYTARLAARARRDAESLVDERASSSPTADRTVMERPVIRTMMAEDWKEAFRQGGRATAYEFTLLTRPWGFRLDEIEAPVHLWHGEQDAIIPVQLARGTAAAIPRCQATFVPDAGHLVLIDHAGAILDTLLSGEPVSPTDAGTPEEPEEEESAGE